MLPKKQIVKTKHNKRRNTAFLYEALMRELTKSIIEKDEARKSTVISLVKEHFNSSSILKRELDLYSNIYETSNLQKQVAEKIISEAKRLHSLLDKEVLFKEQTKLINSVNIKLTPSVFSNFVPFYKNLATISQVFSNSIDIKNKVILEQILINGMCSKEENKKKEDLKPIDDIVCNTFLKKFNEKYGNNLLKEQKELISNYIMAFNDNGVSFKFYLNEELMRLKNKIKETKEMKEIKEDKEMSEMTNKIDEKLDSFSKTEFTKEMLTELMKIQTFVDEANK